MAYIGVSLTVARVTVDRAAATATARADAITRITTYCRRTMAQAIVDCPVDTGNLRAHHRMRVSPGATRITGEVVDDAKYATMVHDGTAPHTIAGRRARRPTRRRKARGPKTLRFVVGGMVVYRRRVHHPGTRARPWLREAARKIANTEGFTWRN